MSAEVAEGFIISHKFCYCVGYFTPELARFC